MRNSPKSLSSSLSSVVTAAAGPSRSSPTSPETATWGTKLGQASGKGIVFFSVRERQLSGTTRRRSSHTDSMDSMRGGWGAPAIFTAGT
ncbi:hypothetical protein ACHAXT_003366 [Thalassiosira profunda]